jgi:hypothetical protein
MSCSAVVVRRRTALVTLIALLAAVGWFAAAQPASAGGPTSVLLANPQAGRVAALYHTDKAYNRLADAVGAFGSETGPTDKPAAVTDDFTGEIRLTWLIHDMSIWRIDRVHATTEDGIWVQTVVRSDGGDVFDQPGTWHRPVDPKALTATLHDAGLMKTSTGEDDDPSMASSVPSSPAAVTNATSPSDVTPSGGLVAAAGVAGLVIGAAGTTLLRRARAGARDRSVLNG